MVAFITKGNGYFWGIVIVEVLWKTSTGLLNQRLTAAILFHDTLIGSGRDGG